MHVPEFLCRDCFMFVETDSANAVKSFAADAGKFAPFFAQPATKGETKAFYTAQSLRLTVAVSRMRA